MELLTPEIRAKHAADNWSRQYGPNKTDIFDALRALGSEPSPEQVHNVIGNGTWTETACDECGARNVAVVEIGQEPDYDSNTAQICLVCLKQAVRLIEDQTQ